MNPVLQDPSSETNTNSYRFVCSHSDIAGERYLLIHLTSESSPQGDRVSEPDDESAIWRKIKRLTPSNAELIEMAKQNPPPQSWYDEEY